MKKEIYLKNLPISTKIKNSLEKKKTINKKKKKISWNKVSKILTYMLILLDKWTPKDKKGVPAAMMTRGYQC